MTKVRKKNTITKELKNSLETFSDKDFKFAMIAKLKVKIKGKSAHKKV